MGLNFDPYDALGVKRSSTPEEVRAAYLQKARKHHPDAGGDDWVFSRIKEAYDHIQAEFERQAREEAQRKARERAAQEARERAERETREKAEREARERAEREHRERAERDARERAERQARERAERDARQRADREARDCDERERRERSGWTTGATKDQPNTSTCDDQTRTPSPSAKSAFDSFAQFVLVASVMVFLITALAAYQSNKARRPPSTPNSAVSAPVETMTTPQLRDMALNWCKKDNFQSAKAAFDLIILRGQGTEMDFVYRSMCHLFLSDYRNAKFDADVAIATNPYYGFTYRLRARARWELGDQYGAVRDWNTGNTLLGENVPPPW